MGKFGAEELTYQSDLDIICLYSHDGKTQGSASLSNLEYFIKLTQWLISCLSVQTLHGFAYKIDTELRPSGQSGALVTSERSFREYHKTSAWNWEKQALIKARPVAGDPEFIHRLQTLTWDIILARDYGKECAQEMIHLRERLEKEKAQETEDRLNLKTGYGGLIDIEFAVQYLQLHHAKKVPALRTPKTCSALQVIEKEGLLSEATCQGLTKAYLLYRRLETIIRLLSGHSTDTLNRRDEKLAEIAAKLHLASPQALWQQVLETRKQVRKEFLTIMV